jgi:cytochrome c5
VVKVDGSELSNAPPPEGGPASATTAHATSLSGIWLTQPGELAAQFGLLGHPQAELTPAGAVALQSFHPNRDIPGIDCVPLPEPYYMAIAGVMSLEVGTRVARIRSELEGVERTVHLNVSTHQGAPTALHGHSIGHWEGNVLVVDSALFTPNRVGTVAGVPSGPRKHLVERFQLDPGGTSLTYTFELEDPDYLAEPMTGSMHWNYTPTLRYMPVKCNLEVARRFLQDLVPAAQSATGSAIPTTGESLFQEACRLCHSAGIGGAPKVGDKTDWGPRIAQGRDLLYSHALQGFTGKAGMMPPKGGRADVPDAVVKQAVDYMVNLVE